MQQLHATGRCHGDLNASNIRVKMGSTPSDVQATVMDLGGSMPRKRGGLIYLESCCSPALGPPLAAPDAYPHLLSYMMLFVALRQARPLTAAATLQVLATI